MPGFANLSYDTAHVLDTGVLVLSFALLYQRRLFGVIKIYAVQAFLLAAAAAWQAHAQEAPHLYITAGIALIFKAMVIPFALHRIIVYLNIHRTLETALGIGPTMVVGVALVALSILLVLPVTAASGALTRESLAAALSIVLLGLLMMITRRNAVSQVVGFMSLENGLILAATGAKGMPLVVEISVAFSVLIAFIVIGIFLFRIRERFDTVDMQAMDRFRGEQR
jgi:hydrogenase-4 component E